MSNGRELAQIKAVAALVLIAEPGEVFGYLVPAGKGAEYAARIETEIALERGIAEHMGIDVAGPDLISIDVQPVYRHTISYPGNMQPPATSSDPVGSMVSVRRLEVPA